MSEPRFERSSFVDLSGRNVLKLAGTESLDFLQRISTNDVNALKIGTNLQTVLTNEKGRIIDVISVARIDGEKLLIAGQSNSPGLVKWIDKFIIMENINITDITGDYIDITLFGPEVLSWGDFRQRDSSEWLALDEKWGRERLCRLLVNRTEAEPLVKRLTESGFSQRSFQEFEEYRITHGIPTYPNELSEQYNPLEANLSSLISWTKGCYVGQEVIARLDTYKKVQRTLARFSMQEAPLKLPASILCAYGDAGVITSAVRAGLGGGVRALGYLKTSLPADNTELYFLNGEQRIPLMRSENESES